MEHLCLEFLGLEIRGNASKKAKQPLVLGPEINLMGRNEIRLAHHATLTVNGGVVSSLRCIDIYPGATPNGHGSVQANIYNDGAVAVTSPNQPRFNGNGDYHQSAEAESSAI